MKRVLAAMSGGVDSTVCAALLKDMGYEVVGVTMLLSPETDPSDAELSCRRLGIEFHAVDMRQDFQSCVIDPFIDAYLTGLTPNPCVLCNKALKFGRLFQVADQLGCEYIATGHYVRKTGSPGAWSVTVADDIAKDQSYVLYALTQAQLDRLLFPMGDLTKNQTRDIARRYGLEVADKAESQDICFIPDGDYAAYISAHRPDALKPGDFLDQEGQVIGRHKGVAAYTLGQRRGLGLPMGSRVYVVGKDAQHNTVTVGTEDALFCDTVSVRDVVFTSGEAPKDEIEVTARLRYNQRAQQAWLRAEGDHVTLRFEKPQRAATPGQAAVFYIGSNVLGGGTIK